MELRNLIAFSKIAELQSFSKAAQALGYAQSSVTTQIKSLEQELNVRLFDRISTKVYLTDIGKEILEYANSIIDSTNNIKTITQTPDSVKGKIRLGTLFSLYVPSIPSVIQKYHQKYPNVEVMVKLGVTKELVQLLNENKVDFILTLDRKFKRHNWNKIFEYYTPAVFICSPNNPLANKKLPLKSLVDKEFVLTRTACNYREIFDAELLTRKYQIIPFLEIDDMPSIMDIIHNSNAISLLPIKTVATALKNKYLAKNTSI